MRREDWLPDDARRLIAENVDSVGALDLLLLVRGEPERWWSPEEVSDALHCPARWAALQLEALQSGGLLAADGDGGCRYAFRPRSARLTDAVNALAEAYTTHAREVVWLIFTARRRPRRAGRKRSHRSR
jgi:hypothetical protein